MVAGIQSDQLGERWEHTVYFVFNLDNAGLRDGIFSSDLLDEFANPLRQLAENNVGGWDSVSRQRRR